MATANDPLSQLRDAIESHVDHYGLTSLIDEIAGVCHAKAEHVRITWQDENLAVHWTRAAQYLERGSQTKAVRECPLP